MRTLKAWLQHMEVQSGSAVVTSWRVSLHPAVSSQVSQHNAYTSCWTLSLELFVTP